MRKIHTKLSVNKETIRKLAGRDLRRAIGGLPKDTEVDEICGTGGTGPQSVSCVTCGCTGHTCNCTDLPSASCIPP
jgi:hypothetical protein